MTMSEAAAFLRGLDAREHAAWERARWQVWASLKPYTKKDLEPQDVMRFAWEDAVSAEAPDERELERIRELAKRMEL